MANILIAGCGYLGSELASLLIEAGHKVWALRRNIALLPAGVYPIQADLLQPESLTSLENKYDIVFYTAAADSFTDEAYYQCYVLGLQNVLQALKNAKQKPKRIFLISTTAVYGQQTGEWVDETSPTSSTHFSGIRHVEAESLLYDSEFPATVVRFAGIYGPQRLRLLKEVQKGRAQLSENPVYTNRIHIADCAAVLHHLMTLKKVDKLYLGVDCEPALSNDVILWLAEHMYAKEPEFGTSEISRVRSNRRCKNTLLLKTGYQFLYPDYKAGYSEIIADIEENKIKF